MAASITSQTLKSKNGINVISIAWTTASDGTVAATETGYNIDGKVIAFVTNPGTAAPTAAYDPALANSDGAAIDGGALADRSATVSELVMPLIGTEVVEVPVLGPLTFSLAAGGDTKSGVIDIYFTRYN